MLYIKKGKTRKLNKFNFNGINCETGGGTVIKRNHLESIGKINLTELSLARNRRAF